MQMNKFEEKAAEFFVENSMTPGFDCHVLSKHKSKKLAFAATGFMFEVTSESLEDLFDKAFRVLKSYGPKATKGSKEEALEQGNLPGVGEGV